MGSETNFGLPFVNDSTNSCGKLLQCSERVEVFDKMVFVTNWDEVRAWQAVVPMCCYESSGSIRHRKNSKNGKKTKKNEFNHHKSSGNDLNNNSVNCLPSRKLLQSHNGSAAKNEFIRSVNVLSYGVPSWRFLVSAKTFSYINRPHPKDISKFSIAVNTYDYRGGSCKAVPQQQNTPRIDPALFFDEKIAASYESYKHYKNRKTKEDFFKLQETSDHLSSYTNISSFKCNGEIDGGNQQSLCRIKNHSKSLNDHQKHRRFNSKTEIMRNKLKTNKKKQKKKVTRLPSDTIKSSMVLPIKEQLEKVKSLENFSQSKTNLVKSPFLPSISNTAKSNKSQHCLLVNVKAVTSANNLLDRIQADNSNLYLPTLNYGNYKKGSDKMQENPDKSKLPPICGVGFNSLSNTIL